MIKRITAAVAAFVSIASVASAQITISQRVVAAKEAGTTAITIGVLGEPVAMNIDDLAKQAVLVVEARVTWMKTYINQADTAILSDFGVVPMRVMAGHPPPAASNRPGVPTPFVVTTYGGEVVKNGVTVRAVSHSIEQLRSNGIYLLFLKPFGKEAGHFNIVNAAAFEITDDRIRPLARDGHHLFREFVDLPREDISRRVSAAARNR